MRIYCILEEGMGLGRLVDWGYRNIIGLLDKRVRDLGLRVG
jgi:hypothetical protein